MPSYSNSTVSSITLNIFSSILEIIAFIISFILLSLIIYQFFCNNYRQSSVPVILSINALTLHIAKGLIRFISVNFGTLKRDFHFNISQNDSFACRFHSYLFFSIVSTLYWSYVLQAIFRFTRVLYPRSFWLHQPTTYLYLLIPSQILLAFTSVLPLLLISNSIHLIPDEIYCTMLMKEYTSLFYFFLVIFCLPLSIIFIFYFCLIYKIHFLLFRCSPRDCIVIRRIISIMIIISSTSLPAVIDLSVYVPNGHIDIFIHRIQWLASSINSLIFVISLPFVNPQLCKLLKKRQKYKKCVIKLDIIK